MDCKIHWTQVMHPQINKRKFTKEEDQRLLALANEHKGHNWQAIADALGVHSLLCIHSKLVVHALLTYGFNRPIAPHRSACNAISAASTQTSCEGTGLCFKLTSIHSRARVTDVCANRRKWTKQEDKELVEAVRLYGNKNWQQVAHCLKDRTGQQCLHRWQKTLSPDIRRGRWISVEDMVRLHARNTFLGATMKRLTDIFASHHVMVVDNQMLTLAVKAYGENLSWVKVQTQVPGRTDVQCRERWVNILNPALNIGPWTEEVRGQLKNEMKHMCWFLPYLSLSLSCTCVRAVCGDAQEDEKLRQHVEAFGAGKWSEIAKILHPRTDNQCWRRWKSINVGAELDNYRRIVHKKRKVPSSRPEARISCKPSLTHQRFRQGSGQQFCRAGEGTLRPHHRRL
jgi:myb proto-oncogene protein